ncbi:DUF726 domain-containing protein [Thiomicrorhabdus xiamenensis]|uniref:DUF726 domain-containing protein n=1 Tax=Thiomicrorhabdus xiamenensis TaxID=2739063 RepID=A0A7D4P5F3_9GAMM|nr:DUF726 domain-containing protein [Thiomicrorhabdus xiamenensis]QKI89635.1 DUF726 domain-containing protein [Thiomicrorhabdus xiamenensis]
MFNNLKKSLDKGLKKASTLADDVKEVASSVTDTVSDLASDVSNKVEKTVSELSDEYLDSGLDQIESYCSWCFEKTTCTLSEKNSLSRNIYVCDNCGNKVTKCRACDNKAKYADNSEDSVSDEVGIWSGNFCAVHEGSIAKFETLAWKLETIGEYREIVQRSDRNYKKIGMTTAMTVGGVAAIAPMALMAAPAIGGAVGSSFLGLSGAAATNGGLAALGGGALAAGGAGMAGGVAVVTATGAALGGRYGAVIANSYYGDIEGFDIVRIKHGKQPVVICIDGFLTQEDLKSPDAWLEGIREKYPENEVYHVKWESKRLRDIADYSLVTGGKSGIGRGAKSLAMSASKKAAKKVAPLGMAFQALGVANNPWSVASVKAYQTGALLADIISRTDKEYILIGHSLGSRVIYSCLSALATKDKQFIDTVHLLAGAVNNTVEKDAGKAKGVNWFGIDKAVSGNIYNYYSSGDRILQTLYKVGEAVKFEDGEPIGRAGIEKCHKQKLTKIKNINAESAQENLGHTGYKPILKEIFALDLSKEDCK